MMQWLQNLFRPKPPTKVRILNRDPFRITIREWRQDRELCHAAALALQNETVRRMLDVLHTNNLSHYVLDPAVPMEERAIRAAQCEGYVYALRDFESLSIFFKANEPLEATFAPDNFSFEEEIETR